jgi:hypothetical protein
MSATRLLLLFCFGPLAFAASVSGRVWIAALDQPLPNASVTLFREPDGSKFAGLHSADDGHYSFEDVPPGAYRMLVEAPGWRSLSLRSIAVSADQAVILPSLEPELDGVCGDFEARPMNDRALLPGNMKTALSGTVHGIQHPVKLVLFQNNKRIAIAKTDADGKYQFANLSPGDYQIEVRRFGYRTIIAIYEKAPAGFEIFTDFTMNRCPGRVCAFPIPPGLCQQPGELSTDSQAHN